MRSYIKPGLRESGDLIVVAVRCKMIVELVVVHNILHTNNAENGLRITACRCQLAVTPKRILLSSSSVKRSAMVFHPLKYVIPKCEKKMHI